MFPLWAAMSMCASLAIAGCYEPGVGKDELDDAVQAPVDLFSDGGGPTPTDGRPAIYAPGGAIEAPGARYRAGG